MDFVKEWITNIILFVLLATVIELLLPNTKMEKYVKTVVGLLLISIILSPILKLFSENFEQDIFVYSHLTENDQKLMENSIEEKKREIQAMHDAYILEEVSSQLKELAKEELMDEFGLNISKIDLVMDSSTEGEIEAITVYLQDHPNDEIEVVKKVEINTRNPLPSVQLANKSEEITSLLSKLWGVNKAVIDVVLEGGDL